MNIQSVGTFTPATPPVADKVLNASSTTIADKKNAITNQTAVAVPPAARATSAEEVNRAVKSINQAIQVISQNLEFSVDTEAKEVVVKVIDQQTKQVLRQIPTEEALDIAKSLDKLQGLLIRQQA
ncbi:MAG: flagellar protein FlaG [Pseudomonadota bacterium]